MTIIRSGQITITGAGTAVQGTDNRGNLFAIVAHPGNSGTAYFGNDGAGDVTSSNGYPLIAGGSPVLVEALNLSDFWFDSTTDGDKVCWVNLSPHTT